MAKPSMEEKVLEIFFDYPSKHWHFSKLKEKVPMANSKLSRWLKKFVKEKLILKVKEKGKMPYYIGYFDSPNYKNTKKLFALQKFQKSGLFNHLLSLKKTITIIIFGSFSRADWTNESDIDLFIYGNTKDFDKYKYQFKLHREIQLFAYEREEDLKKANPHLIKNISTGYYVKGHKSLLGVV